nr:signal peptidase [Ralstonia solanacearum]
MSDALRYQARCKLGWEVNSIFRLVSQAPYARLSKSKASSHQHLFVSMKNIINKKAFFFAAAGALIAGAGNALAAGGTGIVAGPNPAAPGASINLVGENITGGCVRFYVNGQQDVSAHTGKKLGQVKGGQQLTASVFKGACGGVAVKTVQFTVPGKYTTEYWNIQ